MLQIIETGKDLGLASAPRRKEEPSLPSGKGADFSELMVNRDKSEEVETEPNVSPANSSTFPLPPETASREVSTEREIFTSPNTAGSSSAAGSGAGSDALASDPSASDAEPVKAVPPKSASEATDLVQPEPTLELKSADDTGPKLSTAGTIEADAMAPREGARLESLVMAKGSESIWAAPGTTASNSPAMPSVALSSVDAKLLVVSTPEGIGEIIIRRVQANQSGDNRITVQLDPPELGRVAIDFRYDGHGSPQITVTADSPEALRQLRQMHADLLAALERNGVSGGDVAYRDGSQRHEAPHHDKENASQGSGATQSMQPAVSDSSEAPNTRQGWPARTDQRLDIRL